MLELHIIKNTTDPLIRLIADDPVRPEIKAELRVGNGKEIIVLLEDSEPQAVICVSYQDFVPKTTAELCGLNAPTVAVFYTIWSYKPGAGKTLIFKAKNYIKSHKPTISRYVTLSPKTDMARNFHLKNGARVLQVNEMSVNYEYTGEVTESGLW